MATKSEINFAGAEGLIERHGNCRCNALMCPCEHEVVFVCTDCLQFSFFFNTVEGEPCEHYRKHQHDTDNGGVKKPDWIYQGPRTGARALKPEQFRALLDDSSYDLEVVEEITVLEHIFSAR